MSSTRQRLKARIWANVYRTTQRFWLDRGQHRHTAHKNAMAAGLKAMGAL